jgi:Bacterial Ig-like domain (group 2)/Nidogen-like/Divergent InlB B-repeat domain
MSFQLIPGRKLALAALCLFLHLSSALAQENPSAQAKPSATGNKISVAEKQKIAAAAINLPIFFEANQGQTDPSVQFVTRGQGYTLLLTPTETVFAESKTRVSSGKQGFNSALDSKSASMAGAPVRMQLVGANLAPAMTGLSELPGKVNYLIGNDPLQWHTGVSLYSKVRTEQVYPGVDLLFHGDQRQLEYDFVVAPGADPSKIEFRIRGAARMKIDSRGDLVLHTAGSDFRMHKPIIYQIVAAERRLVDGSFVRKGNREVAFRLGAYDHNEPLVIDPAISYASFLGGAGIDQVLGVAVDDTTPSSPKLYISGTTTDSTTFPEPSTTIGSGTSTGTTPVGEVGFIAEVNPTASGSASLIYLTFVGGKTPFLSAQGGCDSGFSWLSLDETHGTSNVEPVLGGVTTCQDYPTTTVINPVTATAPQQANAATVTRLTSTGTAVDQAALLGGNEGVAGGFVSVGNGGEVVLVGSTSATNLPTQNPYVSTLNNGSTGNGDCFAAKLERSDLKPTYLTYLNAGAGSTLGNAPGCGGFEDSAGNILAGGNTASGTAFNLGPDGQNLANGFQTTLQGTENTFVIKLNPTLSGVNQLIYATYFGGGGQTRAHDGSFDLGNGVVAVVGGTTSTSSGANAPDIPLQNAYQSSNLGASNGAGQTGFLLLLDTAQTGANSLLCSTYFGGSSGNDDVRAVSYDAADPTAYRIVLGGETTSSDFPVQNALQTFSSGEYGFVSVLKVPLPSQSFAASLYFSTYIGDGTELTENGNVIENENIKGVTVDTNHTIYASGSALSSSFFANTNPATTVNGFQTTCTSCGGDAPSWDTVLFSITTGVGAAVQSITITPASAAIAESQTQQFHAEGFYSDGTIQDITSSVTWSSTNTSIAQISNTAGTNGLATAGTATGQTTISASLPGLNSSNSPVLTVGTPVTINVHLINNGSSGVGTVTDSTGQINCTNTGGEPQSGTCSANYAVGANVTFTETPGSGSVFTGWQDDCSGTTTTCTISVSASTSPSVLANFGNGPGTFTLNITPGNGETGSGQVSSQVGAAGSINCILNGSSATNACSATVKNGSVFVLTEVATGTSTFTGWSGACSGTGSCVVTMTQNQTVSPTFTAGTGASPALGITKTHTGNFTQGQNGATYTVTVSNGAGAGPTNGTVTVTDTIPTGLTLVSMAGTGWTCATNSCTRSDVLAAGASYPTITVTVNVASNAPGSVVNAVSASGGGSATANATDTTTITTGTGPGNGVATVTPSPFDFGGVPLNVASAAQTFSLSNTGTGPLGSIAISTTNSDYAISNNTCPSSLAAGAPACTFAVTFTPSFQAPDPGAIVVTDDSSAGPTTVPLSGSGEQSASVYVLPFEIFWDGQTPGTASTPQSATVFNTTDSGVSITGVTFVGNAASDFSVASNNCGDGANPSCSISVIFTPSTTVLGPRTADLTIATNQTETPLVSHLTGNGAIRHLPGFTANVLAPNDDSSTGQIALPFTINFFGESFSSLFVNNNGNVTFTQPLREFTPTGLNGDNGGIPIIAPFWADVDTTGVGSAVVTYGTDIVNGHAAFGVNYENVGYYRSETDKLNSFQVILIDRSDTGIAGAFDIEFNYDKIQWEAGDVSGGVDGLCAVASECAAVGYSNGSGTAGTNFQLNGSFTIGALLDDGPAATSLIHNGLNNTMLGRYLFQVRNGLVQGSLTVTEAGTGAGTVTSAPTGINCPTTCSANFASGAQVTLTARPSDGSTFVGWSGGGCTGTGTCVVTLNAATTVTATFNSSTSGLALTVTEAGTGTGTVASAPTGISCPTTCSANFASGTQVTLTAAASANSTFAGWSGGGCTGTGTCVVTVSAATAVTATFNSASPVTIGIGQGSSSTVTTTPGSSAVFGLVLTALPGTTGTVQLTCSSPVASITCNIVPSSITLTGKAINVAIVVETFCKGSLPNFVPMPGASGTGLGLLVATLCLCGMAWTYKKQPRWAVSFGLLVIFAVGMSACSNVAKSPSGSATPPGSYPLVVTATAPNGATSSVNLTLVVK